MPLNFLNNGYFAANVGIGTETPNAKLEIVGGTSFRFRNATLDGFTLAQLNTNSWGISGLSSSMKFSIQNSDLYIPNGNVGIGTSTPNAKLDIQGTQGQLFSVTDNLSGEIFAVADISGVPIMSINSSGSIKFGSYSGTNQTGTPTYMLGTTATGGVVKVLGADIPGVPGGSGTTNFLARWTPDSDTLGIGVTFDNGTNVGIGTTDPLTQLHIAATGAPDIRIQDLDGTNQYGDRGHNGGQTTYVSRNNTAFGSHAFYSNNGTATQLRVKFDETFGAGSSLVTASGNAGDSYGGFLGTSDVATVQMWASHGGLIYIGSRSNHGVNFTINNTVKMVLNTNGNVGIGTTSPVNKIQANYAPVAITSLTANSGTASTNWNRNAFLMGTGASISNALAFGVSGTANDRKAWIQSGHPDSAASSLGTISLNPLGGNVGIGDTLPVVKLQVSTNSPTNNVATLIGDGWVGSDAYHKEGGLLLISGTSQDSTQTGAGIAFQTRTTANSNYWKSSIIMDRDGAIRFTLGGAGTSVGSEDFTILSNGKIGIGITAPTANLQVAGNTIYNNDGAQALRVCDAADISKGIHIGYDTTLDNGIIQAGDFGIVYKDLLLNPNAGNVGIGLTSATAKLHVAGTGLFTGLVSGITPVAAANFVTKAYVDGSGGGTGPFLPLAGGTLSGPGNLTVGGTLTVTGITTLNGQANVGSVVPRIDSTFSLGSNTVRFAGIYGDGLTITNSGSFGGNITTNGDITIDNSSGDPFLKLKTAAQEYVLRIDQSDSEKFQIRNATTSVTALSIDTSSNATFSGTVSGTTATFTTFSGDLNGTINTATTAVTQVNAVDNETVATTAYVNNKIQLIPAGLVFQGTWDARTAAEGGAAGDRGNPALANGVGTTGNFYIVSNSGSVNLDGITDWKVGDWAVFIEQGASDQWEKIDNSSVLDGVGTGQTLPLWSGSGTSNTLTDSRFSQTSTQNIITGPGTAGSDLSINVKNSAGQVAIQALGTGEVVIPSNYLFVSSSQGAYIAGILRARGGVTDDGGTLNLGGNGLTTNLTLTSNTKATFAGDVFIKSAALSNQENTDVDTGTETVGEVSTADFTAAFFDFVVKKTTNVRSGTVYACHDGTNVQFTETSTQDLGNTSDVVLSVDISGGSMRLRATVASDDWSIKSLIRGI